MNSKIKLAAAFVLVGVLTASIGAGVAWFGMRARPAAGAAAAAALPASGASGAAVTVAAAAPPPPIDTRVQKFVTLDKVIVMLKREPTDTATHYLAIDLVFRTPEEKERMTRDHLPLLRSVAVKALSAFSVEKASPMTIDQFAAEINHAFTESYERDRREKPFSEAMIGKLIIE